MVTFKLMMSGLKGHPTSVAIYPKATQTPRKLIDPDLERLSIQFSLFLKVLLPNCRQLR